MTSSVLLAMANEIRAVYEERDLLAKARADASAELSSMRRDRDILRKSVQTWQEAEAKARGRWKAAESERDAALAERDSLRDAVEHWHDSSINERVNGNTARKERDEARDELHEACAERDQARAELAGVAAQRDSWMAKSLAERLHALQSAATPTPAPEPVEVDGFRVGDLVSAHGCTPEPIARFVLGHAQLDDAGFSTPPTALTRKPVEVGDTVRCISGPFAGRVGFVQHDYVACMGVRTGPGEGSFWTEPSKLVVVKP